MKKKLASFVCLIVSCFLLSTSAQAIDFEWVDITNPSGVANQGDTAVMVNDGGTSGYGSVAYNYKISACEVTNTQYAEFLNAVAASDPYGLYNADQSTNPRQGITRTGNDGYYQYDYKSGYADLPVLFVSLNDAFRFVNWLNSGSTETGAYQFTNGVLDTDYYGTTLHNPEATYWIPTEDEWYKAAYYNPATGEYYLYATGSDATPDNNIPDEDSGNSVNYNVGGYAVPAPYLTEVGAYDESESPYGTYDQSGSVWEWNETLVNEEFSRYGIRGGSWFEADNAVYISSLFRNQAVASYEAGNVGFRISGYREDISSAIPEPMTFALFLTSISALFFARRKKT